MNRPPRRPPPDEYPGNPGGGRRAPRQGRPQDDLEDNPILSRLSGGQKQRKSDRPGRFAHVIRPSRRFNVIIFFCLIVFSFVWIAWTVSDVTGEYASSGHDREVVRLSFLRLAANVKCRLNWGTGATMEATINKIDPAKPLHIVFQTPPKWVQRGRQMRTVILDGKFTGTGMNPLQGSFQENEIKARLTEGGFSANVRLMRNSVTSLWRQVQAHWPWAEI